ncbi:Git3 domain-containing protein [Mycena venus]|uniref:Git3 domain-containing protein n=1 Tax=Mycena venus TaxID=2733690 RepID=A0A8H6X2B4_9AGAR|nr:Git3 domain-containing protein [Mycena venus]
MSSATLPDGSEWLLRMDYTLKDAHGVTVLIVVSCLSLAAVVSLLLAISLSAFNTRAWKTHQHAHLFVRSHVAAYLISLLFSDIIQAVGSILNARWILEMTVVVGDVCTIQGVLKQTADVATAFWTFVIALHTFCHVCLGVQPGRIALWTTLLGGWSGIGLIVIIGPTTQNTHLHGSFYGISGYWCWISPAYTTLHTTLDYMFASRELSALLTYVYNTTDVYGRRIQLCAIHPGFSAYAWQYRIRKRTCFIPEDCHCQSASGARNLRKSTSDYFKTNAFVGQFIIESDTISDACLRYPVAYTIIILPIAAARFSSFAGHDVPFELWLISDTVFLLSGVVNVTVFTMTRRILPPDSFKIPKWSISHSESIPEYTIEAGPNPLLHVLRNISRIIWGKGKYI